LHNTAKFVVFYFRISGRAIRFHARVRKGFLFSIYLPPRRPCNLTSCHQCKPHNCEAVTIAALNFAMIAYNFISLFRQVVLGQKIHQQMKTLRYNVFAIGG
jgi:hypothetical protein